MNARFNQFGMVLTYRDSSPVKPAEYEKTRNKKVVERYKQESRKHLNALLASVREHKQTKKGKKWQCEVWAVASCSKGEGSGLESWVKVARKYERRLHIHMLLQGKPGTTMRKYISEYWFKHHGIVEYITLDETADLAWFERYFKSQAIVERRLILKNE